LAWAADARVLGLSGLAETVTSPCSVPRRAWTTGTADRRRAGEVRAALDELTQISLLQLSTDPGGRGWSARGQSVRAGPRKQAEWPAPSADRGEQGRAGHAARRAGESARRGRRRDRAAHRIDAIASGSAHWPLLSVGGQLVHARRRHRGESEASRELDAEAIDRGCACALCIRTVSQSPAHAGVRAVAQRDGSEVRTTASLPLRMLIVDRKIAVVPVTRDDSGAARS